ncbi:hypothetical protein [Nostoc sp.]|uniref:hypothetical protein n=1 Tax=Nostoc sp. TaxID=1180 RepID=UPI002FF48031
MSRTIECLLRSQHVVTQANIALLSAADNDDYSYIDRDFQPESLLTWGKRGSVINVEMRRYRESLLWGLVADGYTVIDANVADADNAKNSTSQTVALGDGTALISIKQPQNCCSLVTIQ